MKVSDFDFELPEELIAQFPPEHRQDCRMMVLDRKTGTTEILPFPRIVDFFESGDCLVLNDTKVLNARLWGHRPGSGGKVQAFVLRPLSEKSHWEVLLKPGRRLTPGNQVALDNSKASFTVIQRLEGGTFEVEFNTDDVYALLDQAGQIPLPPYITRTPTKEDAERYQTVYAKTPGAVAAPTAGLHFTEEILAQLEAKGVKIAKLTLHVGAGTFKPVDVENVEDHIMHEEVFELSPATAKLINDTRDAGHRIICTGTTTVRVLESCIAPGTGKTERKVAPRTGSTQIFLYPPYKAVIPDALLTNFHLPQSTLIMLICTFTDKEKVFAAYRQAIEARMKFFSYGDCMLLK